MISDTLSVTISEIHRYLENFPAVYANYKPQIEELLKQMKAVQDELDRPPTMDEINKAWRENQRRERAKEAERVEDGGDAAISDERPPFPTIPTTTKEVQEAIDAMKGAGRKFFALFPKFNEIRVSCHHQDGKTVFGFGIRRND